MLSFMTMMSRSLLVVLLTLAITGGLHPVPAVMAGPSADDYVVEASALYNRKEYSKAVELLKKALQLNPRHVRAWSWLGLAYAQMGRRTEAIAAFKKVIELAPRTKDAQAAQQWINRLQQQALPPRVTPVSPVSPLPQGPVYLVEVRAATGVEERNRPQQVQVFGEVYRSAIAERRSWWESRPAGEREWRVVYNLQRRYARFRAVAGVADGSPSEFSAVFEVRGDSRVLHESRPKRVGDVPESVDLDVTGVLQLELLVRGKDPGYGRDVVAVWADPMVYPAGVAVPPLPPPPPLARPQETPPPPPASPPTPRAIPQIPTPVPASRTAVAVMPFSDSSGTHRGAGNAVAGAIIEELFKIGRVDTVSQQRLSEAFGWARYDALDVALARQAAQRVGAGIVLLGIVERFHVTSGSIDLIIRIHYKDVSVSISYQAVDVATGERLLSDSARIALRSTAAQSYQLPRDDEILREATRSAAAEIAQKVAGVWARRVGEITIQFTQAVMARNVVRDADFRSQPFGVGTTFPTSAAQIVAFVSGVGARPGQLVEFIWHGPDRREYARGTATIPQEQPLGEQFAAHHALRPPPGGTFPLGQWRVEIRVSGYLLRTMSFTVTEG